MNNKDQTIAFVKGSARVRDAVSTHINDLHIETLKTMLTAEDRDKISVQLTETAKALIGEK